MKFPRVWAAKLESTGLLWVNYVTKKVRLPAAAPDILYGKARDYGITFVNEEQFTGLIDEP